MSVNNGNSSYMTIAKGKISNNITAPSDNTDAVTTKTRVDIQRSSSSFSSGDYLTQRDRKKGAMTPQPEKTPLTQLFAAVASSSKTLAAETSSFMTTKKFKEAKNAMAKTTHNSTIGTLTTTVSTTSNTKPGAVTTTASINKQNSKTGLTDNEMNFSKLFNKNKLLQLLVAYEQQNKLLQRDLAREKICRDEELSCVMKSLLSIESKLKGDIKSINQRLMEKDAEICRLLGLNRALRKQLPQKKQENIDDGVKTKPVTSTKDDDCLMPEALQCMNCRKQFYDIVMNEGSTQTSMAMLKLESDNRNIGK